MSTHGGPVQGLQPFASVQGKNGTGLVSSLSSRLSPSDPSLRWQLWDPETTSSPCASRAIDFQDASLRSRHASSYELRTFRFHLLPARCVRINPSGGKDATIPSGTLEHVNPTGRTSTEHLRHESRKAAVQKQQSGWHLQHQP